MVYRDTLDNTTGNVSIDINVTAGNRTFYAVINEPDDTDIHSALALANHPNGIKQVQYKITNYLSNGDGKIVNVLKKTEEYSLPMYGELTSTVISTTSSLSMQVDRAVARIDVYMAKAEGITSDATTQTATLRVDAASEVGYIASEKVVSTAPTIKNFLDTPVNSTLTNYSEGTNNGYVKIYSFYIPEQTCPETSDRLVFTIGGIQWNNMETTYNPFILGDNSVNTSNKPLDKIERNHVYRIYCRMSPSTKDVSLDVSVSPWGVVAPQDSILHPGKLGMTNCYIVNPGRSVSIPVLNVYKIWNWQFGEKLSPKKEVKAELIWEDSQGLITGVNALLESADYSYSKIKVQTATGKSGNAVIGMWIDGDPEKTYRWSWHIWVPEDQPQGVDLGGLVTLDRNLGAVIKDAVDKDSYLVNGLFYQWGRKDPFPSAKDWFGRDDTPIYDINDSNVTIELKRVDVGTDNNLLNSVRNPSTYYFSESSIANADWYTENGTKNDALWATSKTIYDPCPEGWKVPSDLSVWQTWVGNNTIFPFKKATGYGRYHLNTNSYYPAAGYRSESDGKLGGSGNNGYWWCTSKLFSYYDRGQGANIDDLSTQPRAAGYSIRCVKE